MFARDKSGNRREDQSSEHRATAEQCHPVIDDPGSTKLCHLDLFGRSADRAKHAVDQVLRSGGDVRQNREDDRGWAPCRCCLKRLRANDQADEEKDRQDRHQRNDYQQQGR